MRTAIPILDAYNAAYWPIYMGKAYVEAEFVKLRDAIAKIESFLVANKKEGSPFSMGTANPTQLDVHIYTHLERLFMLKDTLMDFVYQGVNP